jgi:integrase
MPRCLVCGRSHGPTPQARRRPGGDVRLRFVLVTLPVDRRLGRRGVGARRGSVSRRALNRRSLAQCVGRDDVSEAIALQWRHLELDGSSPHVKVRRALVKGRVQPPKSRYGRRDVPLAHPLVAALRERRDASDRTSADDLVFTAERGAAITPNNLRRRVLKPAVEEANVSWVGFHTFRHTCASMLFAEGRNAVQVQHWLATTRRRSRWPPMSTCSMATLGRR